MMFWLVRRGIKLLIGALMIAVQLAPSAHAAPAQDLPNVKKDLGECSRSPLPQKSVDACTALINSGKLKGSALSAAYFLRALAFIRSNRAAEANQDLAEAAKLDPNGISGLIAQGFLSCDKEETASATARSEVIRRAPKWGLGYLFRGICSFSLRQPNEAIPDFSKALDGMGNAPPQARAFVHLMRGQALAATDKSDDALKDLGKALQMDSHLAGDVYRTRANVYAGRRDWLLAAEEWGRWTSLNPNVAYGFMRQGEALEYAERIQEAVAAYTKAIDFETDQKTRAKYYRFRGQAFSRLEDWSKAIEDDDEAIKLNPGKYLFSRGIDKVLSGKPAEALSDLMKANELEPKDIYVVLWLAVAKYKLGQLNLDELKEMASALDPKWPQDVLRVLMNERSADEPIDVAGLNEFRTKGRRCEFEFFVGELRLAQGNRQEGIRRLQAAVASGITEYVEYYSAKIELRRLGAAAAASN